MDKTDESDNIRSAKFYSNSFYKGLFLNKDEGLHIFPTLKEKDQYKNTRMGVVLFRNPFLKFYNSN